MYIKHLQSVGNKDDEQDTSSFLERASWRGWGTVSKAAVKSHCDGFHDEVCIGWFGGSQKMKILRKEISKMLPEPGKEVCQANGDGGGWVGHSRGDSMACLGQQVFLPAIAVTRMGATQGRRAWRNSRGHILQGQVRI